MTSYYLEVLAKNKTLNALCFMVQKGFQIRNFYYFFTLKVRFIFLPRVQRIKNHRSNVDFCGVDMEGICNKAISAAPRGLMC